MSRLQEIVEAIAKQKSPPVHLWKPENEGEIDIRIDANGLWFHEGEQITRDALVRVFASILWAEDGRHYLVTPVEKLKIEVEDAPYVIQQAELADGKWVVTTNTHEQLIVGVDHPVQLRDYRGQPLPYVNVRYDLWARLSRAVYYQWVEQALEGSSQEKVALKSGDYEIALN